MKPTQRTDMETALMRAQDHMAQAEAMAPAGIATQWVQLARAEIQRAELILSESDTNTTTTNQR